MQTIAWESVGRLGGISPGGGHLQQRKARPVVLILCQYRAGRSNSHAEISVIPPPVGARHLIAGAALVATRRQLIAWGGVREANGTPG